MSTARSSEGVSSENGSACPREDSLDDEDDDYAPTLNNVASLRQGIIRRSEDKVQAPYTILLVGETGVGKSSVLEFIANVLVGKDVDQYDFDILDHTNEQHGSDNQSQTNSARLYTLKSHNGIVVRILDTPGLADTRGLQQDELHKKSIATQIQNHIDSITAVLILTNGTVPRVTVGTDYALSTLSAIFPKSLATNIAFVFTNVLSPLHWNFSRDTLPGVLQGAPQFFLNNPVALQRKFLALKGSPNVKKARADLSQAVRAGEQSALEMLVEFFDWLDDREPQPTAEILSLYKQRQQVEVAITSAPAPLGPLVAKKAENPVFPKTVPVPASTQGLASTLDYLCTVPDCHSNCSIHLSPIHVLAGKLIPWIQLRRCSKCTHPYLFHFHLSPLQSQGTTSHGMDDAKDEKSQFVEDYAGRWPSGLSARVAKAIGLLEESHEAMEEQGISQHQLRNMKSRLGRMKTKLDLLKKAKKWWRRDSESQRTSRSLLTDGGKY